MHSKLRSAVLACWKWMKEFSWGVYLVLRYLYSLEPIRLRGRLYNECQRCEHNLAFERSLKFNPTDSTQKVHR